MKILWILCAILCFNSCTKNKNEGEGKVAAFNLFDQNQEIPDECKPPLATEGNKRAFVKFRGKVNRCVDLVNQYPELGNVENITDCLKTIGSTFADVSDSTCRSTVTQVGANGSAIDVINLIRDRFYDQFVIVENGGDTTFVWGEVQNYFTVIAAWEDVARNQFYPADGKLIPAGMESEIYANIIKTFWNDLEAYSVEWRETFGEIIEPIPPVDPDTGETRTPDEIEQLRLDKNLNFKVFDTMMSVNQKVIEKLFASNLSLDESTWKAGSLNKYPSPIIAAMLGEGLNPFMQRMRVLLKIYDISCKLNNCDHSFYLSNKAYWLVNYFHKISTDSVITPFDFEDDDTSNIKLFMETLESNKNVLNQLARGYEEGFDISNIGASISGSDMPHILNTYKWIYEEALDLVNNYEATRVTDSYGVEKAGLFTTNRISEVNVGFSKSNIERHVANVKSANDSLSTLRSSFNGQKHTLIGEVLAINGSLMKLKDLESRINIDLTEMYEQKNQIDAVRSFISDRRSEYTKKVIQIINDPTILPANKHFFTQPTENFQVRAVDINDVTETDFTGAILKDLDPSDNISKGDILQFSVNGQWSPTCAVSQKYGEGVRSSKVGPRGFGLINSQGTAQLTSVNNYSTKESFSSTSITASACVGGKVPFPIPTISVKIETCANATTGSRKAKGTTSSTTNSNSNRTDASFNLGVNLENTPFSNTAAGSLVLVEMPQGSRNPSEIIKAEIIYENFVYNVTNDNSDYYIIGNDCRSALNSGELAVSYTRSEPQGALALDFVNKVAAVSDELESQVAGLISTGQLSHNVLENIRAQLRSTVGPDISGFNGQMQTLLDSLISNEILILDYKSQLVKMERALETKKQRIYSLLEQFGLEDTQREMRIQTRNWLLSNLDLDFVNTAGENQNLNTLNRILSILDNSLVSYVDFRFRNNEREFIVGNTLSLSSLQVTDSFDAISQVIIDYTRSLLERLEDDLNSRPVIPKVSTGIRIKNPFYESSVPNPFPDNGLYPTLEDSRAFAFWDSLVNPDDSKITKLDLRVDDLYLENGLPCYTQAPIIESMGMYFVPENEGYVTDYNKVYSARNSKLLLEGVSTIPFANGPREYNFVNDIWRYFDAANRMAISSDDGMSRLTSEFPPSSDVDTGLATGRPLFGQWEVGHIPSHRKVGNDVYLGETPIKEIKEVFIGFVLSAQNADFNQNLEWINYCKQ